MTIIHNFLFRLRLSFHFYRKLVISSACLSLILFFFGNVIEVILLIKLIFLHKRFFEARDSLLFYKNFGISPLFLFSYCVFADFILSVVIFKLSILI